MHNTCSSYTHRIYMAGDYNTAVQFLRQFTERGLCVSLQHMDYIYTGGMEAGICVTLINYPKYPISMDDLLSLSEELAEDLRTALSQRSWTIETPHGMHWFDVTITEIPA